MFYVNNKEYNVDKKISLLRFLRDELRLTSVKDGCSEGACGACTVIIDGVTQRACVPDVSMLEGRHITTVEGLSQKERDIFTYAFGEAGAVQCGFCIPGMVLCAKALIDKNPDPSEDDIRFAIRNNYCRCTGYVKIIAAIKLAAKLFRESTDHAKDAAAWQVGDRVHRIDVEEKVLGYGKYPDDLYFDDMVYGSAIRSSHPRARVLSIDASKALAIPGVIGVLTADDIPEGGSNMVGHIKKDQPTLIPVGEITHYAGDSVALVVAEDEATLQKAKKLVKVEYEVLPAVLSPEEAGAEDAPLVFETDKDNVQAHKYVSRGDAAGAIAKSEHVISGHFETPWTEHAFLEPECCVAKYTPENDGVLLLTTDQSSHTTMHECAHLLGVDYDRCKVENQLIGGGFGGKEDMSVQHHAALIAFVLKKTVKVKLTRQESLLIHPKRHPFSMNFTLGCDKDGIIQGVKADVVSDTGAFASLGGPVLERACTHAAGPYAYENFEIEGTAYYTNNPPAGAFRGFGVTQTCFAIETLLNEMAEKIGITPWEIRFRNAITPGKVLPNGQITGPETGLVETLLAVKDEYEDAVSKGLPVGIACAMKNAGVGVGLPDYGRCKLIVEEDEKLHIYSGASCIGQGLGTVLVQMVCTNTPLSRDQVVYERSNTWIAPDSGDTSGSRQTLVTGEAARRACELFNEAFKGNGNSMKPLVGKEFYGEYLAKTDPLGADVPNPVSHVAYGYATQMCIVDPDTGLVKKMTAAHDVGKAVNPLSCEGQIEGGVVMSMGYALTESYSLKGGRPEEKYGELGLFRSDEIPEIEAIVVEKEGLALANGAIGIGEITSIPTAPAIAEAYYKFDGKRRHSLPLENTPYNGNTSGNAGERVSLSAPDDCIGCGLCSRNCPCGAIEMIDKKPVIDQGECLSCGMCVKACPKKAITDNLGIIVK